ncbi:inorganic phosphate transporter [Staphylococcus saprophyticus]|jgi:PiT family inorganic phosphate transporter|uniref:Putative phosphate transport protein n=1 Tax=Staphylococcus saprophyticus subsp. saprophyticus (strain ATCC 15305 / DSM 20229 / NCIMB 8711 / NCTC 7292 / S-41) TaxID=342451 RepID=Q49VK6_STAS1|nr:MULTISPECIES: inorganic phosphate transporter [Staphylococcus]CRV25248.1 Low-affinity inorganic phosphate transporter 1 [Streptococcus equi subsp. equi]AMG18786.1 inorganic phosphate transporter [Staphylococcus saprophyticus]AMG34176.1 inorganic phosphate transporter [Staphylococcus saprophyticus]ASE57808.1 inorganic phosphate transporter [Staphylococcus saprophyticus]ASF18839.1 inorganic phosphate transporter [Staphylococcus saprophyticus]
MEYILIITVAIVIFSLIFDFINGFHDTANAVATAVSTRALTPRTAILLASVMNFIGALTFTGVAGTITKDIVDPFKLENGLIVVLAAIIAAILWNLITWYYGIPSSSSHALIGSIAGAAIASQGSFAVLHYEGFTKIIVVLLVSPIIAFCVGFIMYSIVKVVFKNANLTKSNRNFRFFQIFTASLQSFSHGTNDAQKSMGIITLALIVANIQTGTSVEPQLWVKVACATAMGLGTAVGGWKIIKTVGGNIMKIRPANGAAADLSSALTIFVASSLHFPLSTTHVVSSSILGVGSSNRIKGVKWNTAQRMIITWVITLPISALVAAIIYYIINIFL